MFEKMYLVEQGTHGDNCKDQATKILMKIITEEDITLNSEQIENILNEKIKQDNTNYINSVRTISNDDLFKNFNEYKQLQFYTVIDNRKISDEEKEQISAILSNVKNRVDSTEFTPRSLNNCVYTINDYLERITEIVSAKGWNFIDNNNCM